MKEVSIYTDGACSGNPGPGGWAAILCYKGQEKVLCGGEKETTNNRMELTAALKALEVLKEPCRVTLKSDSRYLVDAVTRGWAKGWRAKGWMRNAKEPAKNPELWEALLQQLERHQVEFIWIKGHAEDPYNDRCDRLAVAESRKF